MIKQVGDLWFIYDRNGTKVLGKRKTRFEAIKREIQIRYFSNKKK